MMVAREVESKVKLILWNYSLYLVRVLIKN